ncbi:hypothetical protein LEP1GSC163_0148 [Leptospira santarosai str. CBC379]|uniref:hypothetical protein n=1 Tax=Leptospira santarosai TaxID=28183 RepID=UPI000297F3D7|nr:hypothetical protein [Leptospira santarosai]EKR89683.1 hypothetical protein LEP1GSC163_0148 [Leptospira santarosai str. CBC379]
MKYSIILLLITFSFSIYSDNQTVSITVAPQDYSSEYRQKEYLEIIKLFESLNQFKVERGDNNLLKEKKYSALQKEVEALNKSLKGKSLTFSSLEHEGSIHELSKTYDFTSGFDRSYLERLKKNSKNKELYLTRFVFPLTDENTGYGQIPVDIISKRLRLEIVAVTSHEDDVLNLKGHNDYAVTGKIDRLQYSQGHIDILTIFIK